MVNGAQTVGSVGRAARNGHAEHNDSSLAETLDVPPEQTRAAAKPLVEIGFLEQTGETFKIPMLYRGGLDVTQGKAFAPDEAAEEDDGET